MGALSGGGWETLGVSSEDPLEQELLKSIQRGAPLTRAIGTWASSYTGWLKRFKTFCGERTPKRQVVPASVGTVCLFLHFVASTAVTYSVVKSASGMLFTLHELALVPAAQIPTKSTEAKLVRKLAKKSLGLRLVNQKDPLPLDLLYGAVTGCVDESGQTVSVLALTVGTMLMVMFVGFLRYADMAMITVDVVVFYESHFEIFLAQRKNDQFRKGDMVYVSRGQYWLTCPYRLMKLLIHRARLSGRDYVFQGWNGRKRECDRVLDGKPIAYQKCRSEVLRALSKHSGVPVEVLSPRYGTQSLRSGGATVVAPQVSFRAFQQHGAWHTAASAHRYILDTTEARCEVTRVIGY